MKESVTACRLVSHVGVNRGFAKHLGPVVNLASSFVTLYSCTSAEVWLTQHMEWCSCRQPPVSHRVTRVCTELTLVAYESRSPENVASVLNMPLPTEICHEVVNSCMQNDPIAFEQ